MAHVVTMIDQTATNDKWAAAVDTRISQNGTIAAWLRVI